ncbi:bifunctional (p)ppGpp synthetase/guanosine-3',5'-bis(diphosphate) 3'-pyrophosphohydrolase [Pelagibacterales bacterium SAG-MED31]|nr:bifunctional (p)ppGpp synthetase/guanosine-3',5'-bis(diphosphate) 3'-pyrophosphohydrolase [Pelagibacterales bacterium SAG-MED31]
MIIEKIKELEKLIQYLNERDKLVVSKAINFSNKAHEHQIRQSGDPFFTHPIEVAKILTSIKLDASSIAAGLLHDTVEDTDITNESIQNNFGEQISQLVQGLTKINKMSLKANKLKLGENYRKLLLAATEDLRVILVKLADRLHNMRTIEFIKDENKRINTSMETLEVFSPLAQRLGMKEWQDELEDLAFKSINPEARNSIIDRLDYLKSKDENIIDEIRYELTSIFLAEDLNCKIDGRIKSPYSIWNKIKKKNISFEQLSDIMAFRIITNSTRECYKCLGVIHRKFSYIQGRFKDFISAPKSNGYRAIHTSVMGPKNKKIEIQFRSNVMDQIADFGVAAHWKYKDPKKIKDNDSKEYKWMHELVDLMNSSINQDELIQNAKINVFQNDIYVFTPKGDVIELPKNATSVDFAYSIHSQIGDKCVGAKVNGKLQPLKTILKNGDQIEIITSEESQPSPLWQRFAVTSKVKSQVRRFFRTKKREEYILFGKQILESFFEKENYELNTSTIKKLKKDFKFSVIEDLYELVGSGNMTAFSVLKKIYPEFNYKPSNKFQNETEKSIKLKGLTPGMSYHLSGCCSPIKGDTIVGIVTAGIGVAVHTVDCETLSSYSDNPERWLNISWENTTSKNSISNARLNVVLKNQPGSLGKVTTIIAKNNGNISNINFSIRKVDFYEIIIDIEVRDTNHLKNILAALRLVSEVSSLERIKG